MAYEIVFTDTALAHFHALDARWRSEIKAAIEKHLRHDPDKVSKSRIKRLRGVQRPEYRLRLDRYRISYDIGDQDVIIIAIVPKDDAEAWLNKYGV